MAYIVQDDRIVKAIVLLSSFSRYGSHDQANGRRRFSVATCLSRQARAEYGITTTVRLDSSFAA